MPEARGIANIVSPRTSLPLRYSSSLPTELSLPKLHHHHHHHQGERECRQQSRQGAASLSAILSVTCPSQHPHLKSPPTLHHTLHHPPPTTTRGCGQSRAKVLLDVVFLLEKVCRTSPDLRVLFSTLADLLPADLPPPHWRHHGHLPCPLPTRRMRPRVRARAASLSRADLPARHSRHVQSLPFARHGP